MLKDYHKYRKRIFYGITGTGIPGVNHSHKTMKDVLQQCLFFIILINH